MKLTVIPAVGSGMASMARTGQIERLWQHLGYYADAFDLTYLTWGEPDEEARLWAQFGKGELVFAHGWRVPQDADVLRCMNLLATLPALVSGKPFVMSYGADYPRIARIHGRPAWKWKALRAVAVRRATRVLVPNEAMAIHLQVKYPRANVTYHPNWVDCERFSPDAGWPRMRYALYVGRLVKEKNLEAMAKIAPKLVCVGDGPLRERLVAMGAVCVGPRPWSELPDWYRSCEVFVMPSLSEGHPKALTEAMACGCACLVSPHVTEGGPAVLRTNDLKVGLDALRIPEVAEDYRPRARQSALDHWDVQRLMPREISYLRSA